MAGMESLRNEKRKDGRGSVPDRQDNGLRTFLGPVDRNRSTPFLRSLCIMSRVHVDLEEISSSNIYLVRSFSEESSVKEWGWCRVHSLRHLTHLLGPVVRHGILSSVPGTYRDVPETSFPFFPYRPPSSFRLFLAPTLPQSPLTLSFGVF